MSVQIRTTTAAQQHCKSNGLTPLISATMNMHNVSSPSADELLLSNNNNNSNSATTMLNANSSLSTATNNLTNNPISTTTSSTSTQRANKPRPLKLVAPDSSPSPVAVGGKLGGGGGAGTTTFYLPRNQPNATTGTGTNSGAPTPPQQQTFYQPVTIEEVLELMQQINNAVKAGQFNSQLSTQIFRLCQQLKISGECMEQSHKNELNRVLVSLRQACCRDSGQLGTPCRLKIMELVELRAMGWRPSLAHSQYYLNRNPSAVPNTPEYQPPPPMSNSTTGTIHPGGGALLNSVGQQHPMRYVSMAPRNDANEQAAMLAAATSALVAGPAPVSAPPFGAVPLNPFPFGGGIGGSGPQPAMFHPAAAAAALQHHHQQQQQAQHQAAVHQHHIDMAVSQHQQQQQANAVAAGLAPIVSTAGGAPSYFLIPASAGAAFLSSTMMMPPPASPMASSTPPQMFGPPPPQHKPPLTAVTGVNVVAPAESPSESTGVWPKGAVTKLSPRFPRPQKVPGKNQFRDEIIIRNADSGKIMGVKGRRVAVVEEISGTIISFQKVAQGSKERVLTITGNTEELIEHAKRLIDETIRRNVSPNRTDGPSRDMTEMAVGGISVAQEVSDEHVMQDDEDGKDGEDEEAMGISIETGEDGVLKLSCADPKVLQAAQEALSEYFTRQGVGRRSQAMTAEERELRKERRKSMPSFSPDKGGRGDVCQPVVTPSNAQLQVQNHRPMQMANTMRGTATAPGNVASGADSLNWRNIAKSTPDLTAAEDKAKSRVTAAFDAAWMRYTRNSVLQYSGSPLATAVPYNLEQLITDTPEIVRQPAGQFNATEYEKRTAIDATQ